MFAVTDILGAAQAVAPQPLHIPDGFLSPPVYLLAWAITVVFLAYALARTNRTLADRQVPVMGVIAAFIFAAQMLNFPIAGGTSGHFVGGALAAIVLGPWAASLVMTAVVGLQALLFQDGGLWALGANVLNMGIVSILVGYATYRALRGLVPGGQRVAAFVAAWLSVVIAAVLTTLELVASGTTTMALAMPLMAGLHVLIGIGEGVITVAALSYLLATRPDLVATEYGPQAAVGKRGADLRWGLLGLAITLGIVLLSPLASAAPDGLERAAENLGFIDRALNAPYQLIPDYAFPGISSPALATILAGAVGALIVFGLALGLALLLRRREAVGS